MNNDYLDYNLLNNFRNILDMREHLFKNLINFARNFDYNENYILKIKNNLKKEFYEDWEQFFLIGLAIAKKYYKKKIPESAISYFKKSVVFRNPDVSFKDLLESEFSLSVIPIDGSKRDEEPDIMLLFIIRNDKLLKDHREYLEGYNDLNFEEDIKLFFILKNRGKPEEIVGKSWQLGAKLAKKALNDGDIRAKIDLFEKLIITGVVEDEKVKKIELGNKFDIDLERTWIIPLENSSSISEEERLVKKIVFVNNVESSWIIVTGKGVVEEGTIDFENNISELHALVGGSPNTVIFSALILNPKKIVLWHSNNKESSYEPAQLINSVLREIYNGKIDIKLKLISSNNMAEADNTLRDYFKNYNFNSDLYFNVTSGNRLMSYAVLNVSRIYPYIKLIYKDIDDKDFKMSMIDFSRNPPLTLKLEISKKEAQKRQRNINWDFLFKKYETMSLKEYLKNLTEGGDL